MYLFVSRMFLAGVLGNKMFLKAEFYYSMKNIGVIYNVNIITIQIILVFPHLLKQIFFLETDLLILEF